MKKVISVSKKLFCSPNEYTNLDSMNIFSLNNLGDPLLPSALKIGTREWERQLLHYWSQNFSLTREITGEIALDRSKAILQALLVATKRLPNAIYYTNDEWEPSTKDTLKILDIEKERVVSVDSDFSNISEKINNEKPAILILNLKKQENEITDIGKLKNILEKKGIKNYHIHVTLSTLGIDPKKFPKINFAEGVDSLVLPIAASIGSPLPGALILTKQNCIQPFIDSEKRAADYVRSGNSTISGSRNGHGPMQVWYEHELRNWDGFQFEADRAILIASFFQKQLQKRGVSVIHPAQSNCLLFEKSPSAILEKWPFTTSLTHPKKALLEILPSITDEALKELASDLLGTPSIPELETEIPKQKKYTPSIDLIKKINERRNELDALSDNYISWPIGHRSSIGSPLSSIPKPISPFTQSQETHLISKNIHMSDFSVLKSKKEVLEFFAKLYHLQDIPYFGDVMPGGTWGNFAGMLVGREKFPNAIAYFSEETHYSCEKVTRVLNLESNEIPSLPNGEIHYDILDKELEKHPKDRPAIFNLNFGTTIKGAIDKLPKIISLLKKHNITQYYVHYDAALFGGMLPFLPPTDDLPKIDFTNSEIDSVVISGHKFPNIPIPSGLFLGRNENISNETKTLIHKHLSPQCGHFSLLFWQAICGKGTQQLQKEVQESLSLGKVFYKMLKKEGYPCGINPFSNTIVFLKPSEELIEKWQLATYGNIAHIITMQHLTLKTLHAIKTDLCNDKNIKTTPDVTKIMTAMTPKED